MDINGSLKQFFRKTEELFFVFVEIKTGVSLPISKTKQGSRQALRSGHFL